MDRGEFAIALTFVTRPDCTREQAKRAAKHIEAHALKLARVKDCIECEVRGDRNHLEGP